MTHASSPYLSISARSMRINIGATIILNISDLHLSTLPGGWQRGDGNDRMAFDQTRAFIPGPYFDRRNIDVLLTRVL